MSGTRAFEGHRGLALARELALVGAECAVAERDHDATDATRGFVHGRERLQALGAEMSAHAAAGDRSWRRLTERFGVSVEGAWLVMLAAASEAYPEVAAALSIVGEDERVQLVTPSSFARLLVSALELPYEAALVAALPGSHVERLGLIEAVELGAPRPLAAQPLRLTPTEARVALAAGQAGQVGLEGQAGLEEAMGLAIRHEAPAPSCAHPRAVVEGAAAILRESGVLAVRAASARAARQLALDLAALREESALVVVSPEELPDPVALARLRGGLVVLDLFAPCGMRPFPEAYVRRLAELMPQLVLLVPPSAVTGRVDVIDAPELDLGARRRIFGVVVADPDAERLASRFRVSLDEVREATRGAALRGRLEGAGERPLDADALARELRAQGSRRMGRLVTHIPAEASFEDLVAPPRALAVLRDIVSYYRAAPRVESDPGLLRQRPLGKGLSCLFSGTPGTGKTYAAQCLAATLGLNLYRIDLSQVVSKYIGETEKSLSRVFDEAEAGHGVLLFDEADALFGKRSEVKDAHDRYANVEVAYLLQRMESFEGVSILTTNLRSNMDTAFVRRIRFIIELPVPDVRMRRQLWERSLPGPERWERGLELDPFVERFALAGGDIHNIGVAAAHLAAADPEGVLRIEHLVRACYRELAKGGLSRSRDDFGALARFLPEGVT